MADLSTEALLSLVAERGYGWYRLCADAKGETLLDGSHVNVVGDDAGSKAEGEDASPAAQDVPEKLRTALDTFGAGRYWVFLKKTSATKNDKLVKLSVVVGHGTSGNQPAPAAPVYGLGMVPADEVGKRIEEAISRYEERTRKDREIEELKRQLVAAQSGGVPASWMNGITQAITVVGVVVLAKVAPESLPAVQAALSAMNAPEPTEHAGPPAGLVE